MLHQIHKSINSLRRTWVLMTPTIMNGNDGRPRGTIMIRPRTFKDIKLGEERYATSYNTVWSKRTVLREQCVHTAICKWVFGDKKALTLEEPTGQPHHVVLYIGSFSGVPNHWWFNQPIILLHDHSADQCLGSILQPFGWEAEMLTNAPIRCCCQCQILTRVYPIAKGQRSITNEGDEHAR